MFPALPRSARLLLRPPEPEEMPRPGQIWGFLERGSGRFVLHRFWGLSKEGQLLFKGDNNLHFDTAIPPQNLVGCWTGQSAPPLSGWSRPALQGIYKVLSLRFPFLLPRLLRVYGRIRRLQNL